MGLPEMPGVTPGLIHSIGSSHTLAVGVSLCLVWGWTGRNPRGQACLASSCWTRPAAACAAGLIGAPPSPGHVVSTRPALQAPSGQ